MDNPSFRRFEVAFSFPGEHRDSVKAWADILAGELTQERILYDDYHDAEFAGPDLDIHLPNLYRDDSELVVVLLCPEYETKRWCLLEWRQIRSFIATAEKHRVMFLSMGRVERVPELGIHEGDGKLNVEGKSPEEVVAKIFKRLQLNREAASARPKIEQGRPHLLQSDEAAMPLKYSNLPGGYIGRLFLGRDEFLAKIRESLLTQTRTTAITQQRQAATGILGLGGIGKTHAAVEYARRHADDYQALLFATGDTPEKLRTSLAALCGVLHLDKDGGLPPDEAFRVRATLDWLAANPGWLLIIDNMDEEDTAAMLTEFLGRLTSGHVLITSRLHDWADNVEPLDLEVLTLDASTELLLKLTERGRRRATDDEEQAGMLAMLLDGLPLAMHQAAGYISEQALTFAAYIARYEQEAGELLNWFSDQKIPLERPDKLAPRPVLVTWKTSFDQLGERGRYWLLVFSCLAPDPIPELLLEPSVEGTPEDAEVLREALSFVGLAERYCLLVRDRSLPQFKIHRLVQEATRLLADADLILHAKQNALTLVLNALPPHSFDPSYFPRWRMLAGHAAFACSLASRENPPHNLTLLLAELGSFFHVSGRFDDAEKLLRETLEINLATLGSDHPLVSKDSNNLAQFLHATGRSEEAGALMKEVLRIDLMIWGPDHPGRAPGLHNYASMLRAAQGYTEAEPIMREVLRLQLAEHGPNSPYVSLALNNLAMLLGETDRDDEAEPLLREALRIEREHFNEDHPKIANRLNNLAQLLKRQKRFDEAEILMRETVRIDLATFGADHPNVGMRLNNLSRLLHDTGRLIAAESASRRHLWILAESSRRTGIMHPRLEAGIDNYSAVLKDMGLPSVEIQTRVESAMVEETTDPSSNLKGLAST